MRQRLRDGYTRAQLDDLYKDQHRHEVFPDHIERVEQTVGFAVEHAGHAIDAAPFNFYIGDLSAGDAAIPKRIFQHYPEKVKLYLGDLTPGYPLCGTIGETLPQLPNAVDLYVCCETVEHVDNPDKLLQEIRFHAAALLLSTPVDNFEDDNPEHLWCWSRPSVEEMLTSAGWQPAAFRLVDMRPKGFPYAWGIWYCQ